METDSALKTWLESIATFAPRGLPPIAETLPVALENLIAQVQPQKIILFGSYAYGDPTPDSDVDLLIVMETTDPPTERFMRVARLLRPRLFPVDILVYTPEEIEDALKRNNFFIREICTRGITLYERI
jgi:predicted nucleotidyltransferase